MKEDCSMQTDQRRKMLFCQLSSASSAVRRVDHGQLNAGDDDQPPTRSAGTSPTDTAAPFHADTCRRSCTDVYIWVLCLDVSAGNSKIALIIIQHICNSHFGGLILIFIAPIFLARRGPKMSKMI